MAKRLLMPMLAAIIIAAMVIPGCGEPVDDDPEQYTLTISSTAGGEVLTPGEGDFTFDEGTEVLLFAAADDGYVFVNWTGDVGAIDSVTSPGTTITMDDDYSITANFELGDPEFYLGIESTEGGSVTTPGEGVFGPFEPGEQVALLAVADEGYLFVNWTGSAAIDSPTSADTFITMNANALIRANFRAEDVDPVPIDVEMMIRLDLYVPIYPSGGQWLADQLETAGFKINRNLLVGSDFWGILLGEPARWGNWNVGTFGWGLSGFPRDTSTWWFVYGTDYIPWHPYSVIEAPEPFGFLCEKLAYREFFSAFEREQLIKDVATLYMDHSPQVLLGDVAAVRPYNPDFECITDAAAGFGYGWIETVHLLDGAGLPTVPDGDIEVLIEQYLLYEDPWNPVGGSAASADLTFLRNMLQERALMHDPHAGLRFPWFIESATVWHQPGLPMGQDAMSQDWLTVIIESEGGPQLTVPNDAWVRWEAAPGMAGQWAKLEDKVAEDEEFPTTAVRRTRVVYNDDIFDTPMHDGSKLSLADFLLAAIFDWDRPQADSDIFDASEVPGYTADIERFRGWKIVEVEPNLVIDYYTTSWALDAELNVTTMWPAIGDYGQFVPWHVQSVGILTEIEGDFVWSEPKASEFDAEHMCYITGDSMVAMKKWLDYAKDEGYLPYEDAIRAVYDEFFANGSDKLDAEIAERYDNLADWYDEMGHFWVSTSRVYLDRYFPLEDQLVLKRFEGHTEPADRWLVEFGMYDEGEAPAHTGAWVDTVVVTKNIDSTAGMMKVVAGDIDFWFMLGTTDPDLFDTFVDAGLKLVDTFGSWTELMLNNYGPVFDDGRPNPFYYPEVREALHHIIDKEFFVEEFMSGMGTPTYALYGAAFGEYQRYPEFFAEIQEAYEYDPVRAAAAIDRIADKMEAEGFELIDGVWHYYPAG